MPNAIKFSDVSDAIANGDSAAVKLRLAAGLSPNSQNKNGETLLSFAAAWNRLDVAKLLLNVGADPNIADKTGGTALMLAAQHGSSALVRLLLKHKASPKAVDQSGHTAAMHADWREDGQGRVIKSLFSARTRCKRVAIG